MTTPRRIVVSVDGSEDAKCALAWAAGLVQGTEGEIVAVHALGLLTHLGDASFEPSAGHRGEALTRLEQEWCRPLVEVSVRHRCLVVDGDPVTAVLRVAKEEAADLVVVGRRGTGGHPGLVLGSTSQQLVHEGDRPVVVVPLGSPSR
ncbi:MAG: universal stress protein [Acidimicrobiales bacterium]